jgi:hypothetical protein
VIVKKLTAEKIAVQKSTVRILKRIIFRFLIDCWYVMTMAVGDTAKLSIE